MLSQKKCIRQTSPTGPSETSAGGSPHSQGEHTTKLEKCLLVSNLSTFRDILHLISLWTWCPAFRVGMRRSVSQQCCPPLCPRPAAARFSRCPLVYKAVFETWLAAPRTGKRLMSTSPERPWRGGVQQLLTGWAGLMVGTRGRRASFTLISISKRYYFETSYRLFFFWFVLMYDDISLNCISCLLVLSLNLLGQAD